MRPALSRSRFVRARVLAATVVTIALVAVGCSSTSTPRPTPAGAGTSTTASGPVLRPTRTVTGDRAGFAHGFELDRRMPRAEVERDLDLMASTGARWLRATVEWKFIEAAGPGHDQWADTDRVVKGALARGMSVIGTITYAPDWARVRGCAQINCAPARPSDYAAFAARAVEHYASLGVHTWELWNEPNHAVFWGPRPDPRAYTALLRATYSTIKDVDPTAVVITGGLAPGGLGLDISPTAFLDALYHEGARGSFDAVGDHPYSYPLLPTAPSPDNAFLQTRTLHDIMAAHGDGSLQIWGTEVGAATRGPVSVRESQQAEFVREDYDTWNSWSFTGPLMWYEMYDSGTGDTTEESYGLVHHDWSAKPGLAAFEAMVRAGGRVG